MSKMINLWGTFPCAFWPFTCLSHLPTFYWVICNFSNDFRNSLYIINISSLFINLENISASQWFANVLNIYISISRSFKTWCSPYYVINSLSCVLSEKYFSTKFTKIFLCACRFIKHFICLNLLSQVNICVLFEVNVEVYFSFYIYPNPLFQG